MLAPNSAAFEYLATVGGIPCLVLPDGRKIERPHRSWLLFQLRWRWLLDSWEGGEAYRMGVYGVDVRGLPVRNLIRHKREYPTQQDASWALQSGRPAGTDPANQAADDDYELRRARTPVPCFMSRAIERHLGQIYTREVAREGPAALDEWWEDVDDQGTTIDEWMSLTIAPIFLTLGQIAVLIEPRAVPAGEQLRSKADEIRMGLDRCVASYILPENIPWWKLDRRKAYSELIVREIQDDATIKYRYWNAKQWALYEVTSDLRRDGTAGKVTERPGAEIVEGPVDHSYGRVPIEPLFFRRRPRHQHIGLPPYEELAEIQREYYNRDSELILSDTTQAHPLLQGPEDYIQPDGTVPIGPNWMLPKKKNTQGGSATYEGFDVVQFPKDGAESIRINKQDLREQADQATMLSRPAGSQGTSGQTVAQSGLSKNYDANEGHKLLTKISKALAKAELQIARLFLAVSPRKSEPRPEPTEGESATAELDIRYPQQFSLFSIDELLKAATDFQLVRGGSGATPLIDAAILKQAARLMLPGMSDKEYEEMDEEIDAFIDGEQARVKAEREAGTRIPGALDEDGNRIMPPGSEEQPPPDSNPDESTRPMKEANDETA